MWYSNREEKHLFLDISSTNIDKIVASLCQCVETRSTEVFWLSSRPLPRLVGHHCETEKFVSVECIPHRFNSEVQHGSRRQWPVQHVPEGTADWLKQPGSLCIHLNKVLEVCGFCYVPFFRVSAPYSSSQFRRCAVLRGAMCAVNPLAIKCLHLREINFTFFS
jgi:hypothetical protein